MLTGKRYVGTLNCIYGLLTDMQDCCENIWRQKSGWNLFIINICEIMWLWNLHCKQIKHAWELFLNKRWTCNRTYMDWLLGQNVFYRNSLIAFGIITSIVDNSLVFGSEKTHVELESSLEMYNIIAQYNWHFAQTMEQHTGVRCFYKSFKTIWLKLAKIAICQTLLPHWRSACHTLNFELLSRTHP